MTIVLPTELEERLRREASREGVAPADLAARIIATHLPTPLATPPVRDLFAQWEKEDRTDDPTELARRQREFDDLKAALNRNRRDTEGPHSRTPFP